MSKNTIDVDINIENFDETLKKARELEVCLERCHFLIKSLGSSKIDKELLKDIVIDENFGKR